MKTQTQKNYLDQTLDKIFPDIDMSIVDNYPNDISCSANAKIKHDEEMKQFEDVKQKATNALYKSFLKNLNIK